MAEENIIYSDGSVMISTSRIVLKNTTYALRNITSVRAATTPPKLNGAILLIVAGAIALLIGISSPKMLVVGGLVIVGAVVWLRSLKTEYHVAIASAGGEVQALTSHDKSYIEKLVDSINDAIIQSK